MSSQTHYQTSSIPTKRNLQTQTNNPINRNGYHQEHCQLYAGPRVVDVFNTDQIIDVGDKINEATSGASKEANKDVAKDSNASLGTRANAAKDAVGDKMDESKAGV